MSEQEQIDALVLRCDRLEKALMQALAWIAGSANAPLVAHEVREIEKIIKPPAVS